MVKAHYQQSNHDQTTGKHGNDSKSLDPRHQYKENVGGNDQGVGSFNSIQPSNPSRDGSLVPSQSLFHGWNDQVFWITPGLSNTSTKLIEDGSHFFQSTAFTTGPLVGVQSVQSKIPIQTLSLTNLAEAFSKDFVKIQEMQQWNQLQKPVTNSASTTGLLVGDQSVQSKIPIQTLSLTNLAEGLSKTSTKLIENGSRFFQSTASTTGPLVRVQSVQSPIQTLSLKNLAEAFSIDFQEMQQWNQLQKPVTNSASTTGPLVGVQSVQSKIPIHTLSLTNLAKGPDEEKKKNEVFNRSNSNMTLTDDLFDEVPPDGSSKKIDEEGEEEAVDMRLIDKSRRIEKFPCLLCYKGFATESERRKHLSDFHRVEMRLKCNMCTYTCSGSRENMVKKHVMVNHSSTKERFYTINFRERK